MDAVEWQACVDRATFRQLRLFAAACCRRIWHLLDDERSREAVEVVESRADGRQGEPAARRAFTLATQAVQAAEQAQAAQPTQEGSLRVLAAQAAKAAALVTRTNLGRVIVCTRSAEATACGLHQAGAALQEGMAAIQRRQAALLRDIVGGPAGPAVLIPAWRTPDVIDLARGIVEGRSLPEGELPTARLAVLGDALEEAGCGDKRVLEHCRGGGAHVLGCWVLDAALARA
jgi:hypothetical protein